MNRPLRTAAGMTLIEVLVALLIFSFGLLGFVGLQVRAIQYSVSAENSNRAALLASEMATTIQLAGPFSFPNYATQIAAWQSRVSTTSGLPNASGTVTQVAGTSSALITIRWQRPGTSSTAASALNSDQYQTQVYVP